MILLAIILMMVLVGMAIFVKDAWKLFLIALFILALVFATGLVANLSHNGLL